MIHRHRLTGTQKALRDIACWVLSHDEYSETNTKVQACDCKLKVAETRCHRCGRTLGSLMWVHERHGEKVES